MSVTPISGDLMTSVGLQGHQVVTWCTDIHAFKARCGGLVLGKGYRQILRLTGLVYLVSIYISLVYLVSSRPMRDPVPNKNHEQSLRKDG